MIPRAAWDELTPESLLSRLQFHVSARQARLIACACVRLLPLSNPTRVQQALDLAERFADGKATGLELASGRYLGRFNPEDPSWAIHWAAHADHVTMLNRAVAWVLGFTRSGKHPITPVELSQQIADRIREIASDPANPIELAPGWLTWNEGTVVKIAREIHAARDYTLMPILGDALEEAGCQNPTILTHCREHRLQVHGCWLVGAILGIT